MNGAPALAQALDTACRRIEEGRLAEAEAICRELLRFYPGQPDALHSLGLIAFRVGRHALAEDLVRRALVLCPASPPFLNTLGGVLHSLGRCDESIASFRASIAARPDYAEAWSNLGDALRSVRLFVESTEACREAIRLRPSFAEAHNNLANVLRDRALLDEAIAEYRHTVELKPSYFVARNNLASALLDHGDYEAAILELRTLLEMCPHFPEAHTNLGNVLQATHQPQAAIAEFRVALGLLPDDPVTHCNLGSALKDLGMLDASIACFRRAVALSPEKAAIHSNIVYALQFLPGLDPREIREEQALWNRRHAAPLRPARRHYPQSRDPARRLKLGYVSTDFREHAVSFFMGPLLAAHDRAAVEVFCYSGLRRPDAVTERFRASADGWRDVATLSDAELDAQIRADGIDLLVDLTMHSAHHRLLVFARQPAPVQVSWLAYPGATGLEAIDYRLTDRFMEPPSAEDNLSTERPIRLPDSWCCYEPIGEFPEVSDLPAQLAGHVTFGSLNNFCKINTAVQDCWARLLGAVPHSRLLIFSPAGDGRHALLRRFQAHGIGADRIEWVDHGLRAEHLRLYQRIDICLDPFPCNGMTTTCHALWMGCPVITLPGAAPVSRASLSLLSTVGLPETIATSVDDYLRLASELAEDLPRLAGLRRTLRARMSASPLMDAPRFARNFEDACRAMWREWCGQP